MLSVVLGAVVAFIVTVLVGDAYIRWMRKREIGQFIREEGPETHLIKGGTPTMGGVVMLAGLLGGMVVVARFNVATLATFIIVAVVAGIGFYDDWQKVSKKVNEGLSVRAKLVLLTLAVILADVLALRNVGVTQSVVVPGLERNLILGPGLLGIAFFSVLLLLVVVGTANAVNLADGLDGLAAGAGGIALLAYTAIAFLERQYDVAIICGGMAGACIGFLWFNSHPAEVFMGDTGSLAIGGVLAAAAVFTKTELLLPLIGGIFVLEALSVILQYVSFKLTGRRVLRMAPFHHHFELLGWEENKVVVRFWILQSIFAVAGFLVYYLAFYNS